MWYPPYAIRNTVSMLVKEARIWYDLYAKGGFFDNAGVKRVRLKGRGESGVPAGRPAVRGLQKSKCTSLHS